jgi:hypothetical protein
VKITRPKWQIDNLPAFATISSSAIARKEIAAILRTGRESFASFRGAATNLIVRSISITSQLGVALLSGYKTHLILTPSLMVIGMLGIKLFLIRTNCRMLWSD